MILGYIRVSTDKQDCQNQKLAIFEYASKQKMTVDDFIELEVSSRKSFDKRRIPELFERLKKGDTLIVTELSRLGRSVPDVFTIAKTLVEDNDVRIIAMKENLDIVKPLSTTNTIMLTVFGLAAQIERDMISLRTKEGLNRLYKEEGVAKGRRRGAKNKVASLDSKQNEITALLDKNVSLLAIAKIIDVPYNTLRYYVNVTLPGRAGGAK